MRSRRAPPTTWPGPPNRPEDDQRLRHERQVRERGPFLPAEPDLPSGRNAPGAAGIFRIDPAVHRRGDHPDHQEPVRKGDRVPRKAKKGPSRRSRTGCWRSKPSARRNSRPCAKPEPRALVVRGTVSRGCRSRVGSGPPGSRRIPVNPPLLYRARRSGRRRSWPRSSGAP